MPELRLTRADVELFAAASGDTNPLHLSPEYARASAFGVPIAHGVLGALAAAVALPDRRGASLRRIALEFPRPITLDTDHAIVVEQDGPDASSIEVLDGSRPVIRGVLEFGNAATVTVTPASPSAPTAMRQTAARRHAFTRGESVAGVYGPDPSALLRRFPVTDKGMGPAKVLALALCSYVIGMELPGELALFTKLVIEFEDGPREGPLRFEARVDGWQARTGSLRVGVSLAVGEQPWAQASLRAFVRADSKVEHAPVSERLDPQAFAGKTALVIGASRGLGRSFTRAFASHGGRVLALARSQSDSDALTRELPEGAGPIQVLRGDATDPETLARLLDDEPKLDVLVCNASPPLQALLLEPATATRIHDHISSAVALVSAPLAICLPRLAASRGVALLSSSQAVLAPPTEWAHYVAAKRAGEALFEVAASQYPDVRFVIARMPRLDTAFTLNVSGEPSASADAVAIRLIEQVAAARTQPGPVEIITDFDRG